MPASCQSPDLTSDSALTASRHNSPNAPLLAPRPASSAVSTTSGRLLHPHVFLSDRGICVPRAWCSSKPPTSVPVMTLIPTEPAELEFRNEDAVKVTRDVSKEVITAEEPMDNTFLAGVPEEHIACRRARIYQPAKNAMQSGTDDTHKWVLEFETRQRWENPTMGWGSSGDPLSNLRVTFTRREDAARFCDKNGWTYFVEEPRVRKPLRKSYADNFSWDKRTRIGSK